MPNIIPKEIKTFKGAIEWLLQQDDYKKPKANVLIELYQGTNKLFPKGDSFQKDTEVSGGICQGMALEWIKKNSAIGGAQEFRLMASKSWELFASNQIAISHMKRTIKILNAEILKETLQLEKEIIQLKSERSYMRESGFFASIKHTVVKPMDSNTLTSEIEKVGDKKREIEKKQALLKQDTEEMYASRVLSQGVQSGKFTKVSESVDLDALSLLILQDAGHQPAYYMINLDKDDAGHCLALHAAYRPRIMDANGCEIQFDSMNTCLAFLNDLWLIYKRVDYLKGQLYRFDVRLTSGDLASKMLWHIRISDVNNQVPK